MAKFIHEDFLLETKTAQRLYHEHAAHMPILDYHCHLNPADVAQDVQYNNITHIWLYGDHYKWRAMRTNGVDERFCTGDASDWEKFEKWAETVPYTLRNPLYHWTHMELKKPFGITKLLNPASAKKIWEKTNEMLQSKEFSARNIMRMMNVQLVCTTDDPSDDLRHHIKIQHDDFDVMVLPTWRPDKAMAVENPEAYNQYIEKLSAAVGSEIKTYDDLLNGLKKRHDFFHETGCRVSDHGLETFYAQEYTLSEVQKIFSLIRSGKALNQEQNLKFKSALLYELALMDHARGWAQQFHIGALRNNNTRLFGQLGPDTGFDSIGDELIARPMAKFLDRLDQSNQLAKTILYNLNPRDNEVMATMIGNFQDGTVPGKMQWGSGWWFLDQKDGMEKQINTLSVLGLLGRFVGMLTDSRSMLSYPRHEYFRRILCNILGNDIERGILPNDMEAAGQLVEDVSYYNARNYFGLELNPFYRARGLKQPE